MENPKRQNCLAESIDKWNKGNGPLFKAKLFTQRGILYCRKRVFVEGVNFRFDVLEVEL